MRFEYVVQYTPDAGPAQMCWQLSLNGKAMAFFASADAAEKTARLLASVDREAGRMPTVAVRASRDQATSTTTGT